MIENVMRGEVALISPGSTWEPGPTEALPPTTRCRLGMRLAVYFGLGTLPSIIPTYQEHLDDVQRSQRRECPG